MFKVFGHSVLSYQIIKTGIGISSSKENPENMHQMQDSHNQSLLKKNIDVVMIEG